MEIDHFRPLKRGGSEHFENLVYACVHCNRFKGVYWPADNAPESLMLLNPYEDDFEAHILLSADGKLIGLTSRGWFHIRWLHLNRPQLVVKRSEKLKQNELEQILEDSLKANHQLRLRIQKLENEVAMLKEALRRLMS